jgi:hypothetical protein
MNYRITTVLLAVALLLVLGVNMTQAAPLRTDTGPGDLAAPVGIYDYTNHGTAWVPELRAKFSLFKPVGWGTMTKAKVAGNQWVHIPVPYPSRIADTLVKIKYVEFCAQSSSGVATKPIRLDLWDYTGRFYSTNIAWPANNNKFCFGHEFNPPIWQQDLGVSVLLHFANATDTITLYKAWVRVTP